MITRTDDIKQLTGNYIGYIWMSDKAQALLINGKLPESSLQDHNPFIIEGQLYDEDNQHSYAIRHDGSLIITRYDLTESSSTGDVSYVAHRIEGKEYIAFRPVWIAEADPITPEYETMVYKGKAFVGFYHVDQKSSNHQPS